MYTIYNSSVCDTKIERLYKGSPSRLFNGRLFTVLNLLWGAFELSSQLRKHSYSCYTTHKKGLFIAAENCRSHKWKELTCAFMHTRPAMQPSLVGRRQSETNLKPVVVCTFSSAVDRQNTFKRLKNVWKPMPKLHLLETRDAFFMRFGASCQTIRPKLHFWTPFPGWLQMNVIDQGAKQMRTFIGVQRLKG